MKDKVMKETIARNLKTLRELHGLSQTDLGKELGKDKTTISTWERAISMPDIVTLYNLSKRYDVSVEDFYIDGLNAVVELSKNKSIMHKKHKKRLSAKVQAPAYSVIRTKDGMKLVKVDSSVVNKPPKAARTAVLKVKPILPNKTAPGISGSGMDE